VADKFGAYAARAERDIATTQRRDAAAPSDSGRQTRNAPRRWTGAQRPRVACNQYLAGAPAARSSSIANDVVHADLWTTRKYLDRWRRRENNSASHVPLDFALLNARAEET